MPNQNRNGRKPPQRLFVRVFENGCIGGGYAYCLTPPEGFDSVEYAQVATNQNECDHTYGVRLIEENSYMYSKPDHLLWDDRDGDVFNGVNVFNYCPECGVKIDWDKIKEEVDDKN